MKYYQKCPKCNTRVANVLEWDEVIEQRCTNEKCDWTQYMEEDESDYYLDCDTYEEDICVTSLLSTKDLLINNKIIGTLEFKKETWKTGEVKFWLVSYIKPDCFDIPENMPDGAWCSKRKWEYYATYEEAQKVFNNYALAKDDLYLLECDLPF